MTAWAVIPAAGVGKRMKSAVPKQYLRLGERTILEHSVGRLLAHPQIQQAVVAISTGDEYFVDTGLANHPDVQRADGGAERCHSVLNALKALSGMAKDNDWVLVHDAARPCIRRADIDALFAACSVPDAVGGILAYPTRDTMKRAAGNTLIDHTVDRDGLWHALTPQMFRLGPLRAALETALEDGFLVTDEASAMEHAGYPPMLVEGHADNLKITRPEDLALAGFYLAQQENEK